MTLSTKILAILGTLLLLAGLTFTIYEVHAINARQDAIEQQVIAQKQLADNITRAMATWATKTDLEQLAKDSNTNLAAIQKDLSALNANLSAINVATATSTAQVASNIGSTNVIKSVMPNPTTPTVTCDGKQVSCPNQDPNGYLNTTQQLSLNEEFGSLKVPFGTVGFNGSTSTPWSVNLPARQYKLVTVLGTDENQRTIAYNKMTVNVNNKDYDVPITDSKIEQVYPSPKFTLFNPRLYLGFDAGITVNNLPVQSAAGPNLNLQVASYGQYKKQPDLSIVQLGVGYDMPNKQVDFLLRPISYNVGQHLPFMDNLYVGPALHLSTTGSVAVTLGAAAAL